jgi:tripartite-type tricarboxylate transporter receptor subunit TctC
LSAAQMKERMTQLGVEGAPGTPEQFADFIRKDTARWAKVIKESGAKPD